MTADILDHSERPSVGGIADRSTAAHLLWFEQLPAVAVSDLIGVWRGEGLPSGHPFDGVLERFEWFGKEFRSADDVYPLLFRGRQGDLFAVEPRLLPFDLALRLGLANSPLAAAAFARLKRLARTRRPSARLRMMDWRGTVSAAMIYDSLPIQDLFRRVDADTVAGMMDYRGFAQPFFFLLKRVKAA